MPLGYHTARPFEYRSNGHHFFIMYWSGIQMVGLVRSTLTNHLKSELQKIWHSNVSGIQMVGIQMVGIQFPTLITLFVHLLSRDCNYLVCPFVATSLERSLPTRRILTKRLQRSLKQNKKKT